MLKPHVALTVVRPDEVAECWDGIFDVPGLYAALWDCVGDYKAPSPEVSEEPCIGMDSVSDFWDRFSDDHKEALNAAAAAGDAEYDEHQPTEMEEWLDFDPDC